MINPQIVPAPLGVRGDHIKNPNEHVARVASYMPIVAIPFCFANIVDTCSSVWRFAIKNQDERTAGERTAIVALGIANIAREVISMAGVGIIFSPFDCIVDNILSEERKHSVAKIVALFMTSIIFAAGVAGCIAALPPVAAVLSGTAMWALLVGGGSQVALMAASFGCVASSLGLSILVIKA